VIGRTTFVIKLESHNSINVLAVDGQRLGVLVVLVVLEVFRTAGGAHAKAPTVPLYLLSGTGH